MNPLLNPKQLTCLETEGLHYIFSEATAKSLENTEQFIYSVWIIFFLALGFIFAYVSVLVITVWGEKGGGSASREVKLCAQRTKYFEICKENPSACSIAFYS